MVGLWFGFSVGPHPSRLYCPSRGLPHGLLPGSHKVPAFAHRCVACQSWHITRGCSGPTTCQAPKSSRNRFFGAYQVVCHQPHPSTPCNIYDYLDGTRMPLQSFTRDDFIRYFIATMSQSVTVFTLD